MDIINITGLIGVLAIIIILLICSLILIFGGGKEKIPPAASTLAHAGNHTQNNQTMAPEFKWKPPPKTNVVYGNGFSMKSSNS
jgi:hypothetical protein